MAAHRDQVDRLKSKKLKSEIDIKLLNSRIEMKQRENKIQNDQIRTI